MNKLTVQRLAAALLLLMLVLTSTVSVAPSMVHAQDAATTTGEEDSTDQTATDESSTDGADTSDTSAPADDGEADEPESSDDSASAEEPVEEVEVDVEVEESPDAEAVDGASGTDAAADAPKGLSPYVVVVIIAALFIIPGFLGSWLAKLFNLPDHGWKMAVAIGTTAAGILAIASAASRPDGFKLGPDLGGGVTLVYDLKDPESVVDDDQLDAQDSDADSTGEGRGPVSMDKMIQALKQRVDPSGTKEVTIRTRGKSIEFIIPKAGQAELDDIKKKITDLGQLEFRILVDRRRSEYEDIVKKAETMSPGQTVVTIGNVPMARWVTYDVQEFGPVDEVPLPDDIRGPGLVKRMGVDAPEILVALDPYNVTGEYLTGASKGIGNEGVEVRFRFDSRGSRRFGLLTGSHVPNPSPYYLGIILDQRLRSAPSIRTKITGEGTISGRGMDEKEVDHVVSILDAGSLPAELDKTPVSEEQTGPEIGELTIRQGTRAMMVSLSIVLVFILIYYRFAGMVACLALVMNIVLVVGTMVILNAAFTLPGLAGLVLTVGMSVDANVLIFERIREELARGSTLRMAIRNGFDRATTTIVDANVTTLITGVVLYVIGTDQIRGFAITLILGIIMSMYTAIFCARILFDIAERNGWITKLSMLHILNRTDIKFMSKWPAATVLSLAVITAGMLGVAARKTNLLNIDFTGGTSVTMVLKKDQAMDIAEVREALEDTELADKNLLVVERKQDGAPGTTYKIDSSMQDEEVEGSSTQTLSAVEAVEGILAKAFEGKLETHHVAAEPLTEFVEGEDDEVFNGFQTTLQFGAEGESNDIAGVSHDALLFDLQNALTGLGHEGVTPVVTNPNYTDGSSRRFSDWTVMLSGLDQDQSQAVIDKVVDTYNGEPVFPLANKIGGRVAGDMRLQAIYAIGVSLLGIVGYIWIRFQKISYGLAAVAALVHDVLVTLGLLALSAFLVEYAGGFASALQIDSFQISLSIVAAFLTIIGYSLNDTIVVFDRIREVRGKSPTLSADMINTSVNQTLSRTLLTSLTTLIVVSILYFFGGDGIHAFAFALVVGVIVGTYSSIFIASPVLLWLSKYEEKWSA